MILKELVNGNKNFKENEFSKLGNEYKDIVENGQRPEVLYIGCSDSRVTHDLMLGTKPGDMFILRNVGNFVPPFKHDEDFHGSAAAIEYAVSVLEVSHIIVCGHSQCGACKSLHQDIPDTDALVHVKTWLKLGRIAKEVTLAKNNFTTEEEMYRETEKNSIKYQLENLLTYPDVAKRIKEGKLKIHGWHYEIETGSITFFDQENDTFKPLEELKL